MADIESIPFGPLNGFDDPHLVPLNQSITANNCFQDTKAITGRNAYRSVLAGAVAVSGSPQLNKRFRPAAGSERFVEVIGGNIYLVTEPSSQAASDGTSTLLGTGTFGANDNVCGAQLNGNFYLNNDSVPNTAVRITASYSLEALLALPTAEIPQFTPAQLDLEHFNNTYLTTAGGVTSSGSGITNWTNLSGTIGGTGTYDITHGAHGTTFDWSSTKWLMVICSPETLSGGGGTFSISLLDAAGNVYTLNTISDPPYTNGSPFVVFCSLVTAGLNSANPINRIRFTQLGPTTDAFSVSGFMPVPTAPEAGTVNYYVTYYNSVTGNESALSNPLPIVYNNVGVVFPAFQAARWNYNSLVNAGFSSSNPDLMSSSDMFNKGIGLAYPASTDFADVYTFFDTIPTAAQYPNADTVRLWRSTPNGISLVKTSNYPTRADGSAWTGPTAPTPSPATGTASDIFPQYTLWNTGNTAWSITDDTGTNPNANQTYQAGGPMPPMSQMTAMSGRLAGLYQNQVSISSFTPVGSATDLIPQWPPIAIEQDDGWQYNVCPAPTEIGHVIIGQDYDALYIGTSEAIRSMSDLEPGSPPFLVLRKGVVGRQAAGYFEDRFMWAGPDGVYMTANQTRIKELTEAIRTYYMQTFVPDSTVVLAYQYRKLFVIKGQNYLRYDFVHKNWTTGTLTDSVSMAASWVNDVATVEELWLLCASRYIGRWQASCARDMQIGTNLTTGTQPPPWTFGSGFDYHGITSTIGNLMVDASGPVQVTVAKTISGVQPDQGRATTINPGQTFDEVIAPAFADFEAFKFRFQFDAANGVSLYRAGREVVALPGGKVS